MLTLAVLLLGAAAAFALVRATGLPAVPLLLVTGVVLSRSGLVPPEHLPDTLFLGLTFLAFAAGVELNPARIRGQNRAALRVGIVQFLLMGIAGFAAGMGLGFTPLTSAYLALAISASSTLVVIRLLRQRRQVHEPLGRLVIGVLLLQDLLVILSVPVIARAPQGLWAAVGGLAAVTLLVACAFAVQRLLDGLMLRRLDLDDEGVLLVILSVLFVFVGGAAVLGLPIVAGGFLGGLALSSRTVSEEVRGHLASLQDFFAALFFTSLGALVAVPTAVELLQAAVLAILVVALTPPVVAWIVEGIGYSARTALAGGLLLSQTSEFSLIVGFEGVVAGQLPQSVFTVIATTTVITMVLTPFISSDRVTWRLLHLHPSRRQPPPPSPPTDHVVLLGCGSVGMAVLDLLLLQGQEVAVVEDDPAIVSSLVEAEIFAIRGDATDPRVLERAGVPAARLVVSTVRRVEENEPLLELAREDADVIVRVFNVEEADWVRARGGAPVVYAEAAAEDFLGWFDTEGPPGAEATSAGEAPPTRPRRWPGGSGA